MRDRCEVVRCHEDAYVQTRLWLGGAEDGFVVLTLCDKHYEKAIQMKGRSLASMVEGDPLPPERLTP